MSFPVRSTGRPASNKRPSSIFRSTGVPPVGRVNSVRSAKRASAARARAGIPSNLPPPRRHAVLSLVRPFGHACHGNGGGGHGLSNIRRAAADASLVFRSASRMMVSSISGEAFAVDRQIPRRVALDMQDIDMCRERACEVEGGRQQVRVGGEAAGANENMLDHRVLHVAVTTTKRERQRMPERRRRT